MSRRGVVEYGLIQVVGAVLALIILGALFFVGTEFARPFLFASKDPSFANIEALGKEIENLLGDPTRKAMDKIPLYLEDDKTLIGFSATRESLRDDCLEADLLRPAQCRGQSCLCLYSNIAPKKVPTDCYVLPGVRALYAVREPDHHSYGGDMVVPGFVEQAFPDNLVAPAFHGACSAEWFRAQFGIKTAYIEQLSTEYGNHLLLTPSTPDISRRYQARIRGEALEDYLNALKHQAAAPVECEDEARVREELGYSRAEFEAAKDILETLDPSAQPACYSQARIIELYKDMRQFHPTAKVPEGTLLALAAKIKDTQPNIALLMYNDFLQWYPESERIAEVHYRRANTIMPATLIIPGAPQELTVQDKIEEAMKDVENLLEMDTSLQEDVYLLRAYYYIGLNELEAALDDLQAYHRLVAERNFAKAHGFEIEPKQFDPEPLSYENALEYVHDTLTRRYAGEQNPTQYITQGNVLAERLLRSERAYQDMNLHENLVMINAEDDVDPDFVGFMSEDYNIANPQIVIVASQHSASAHGIPPEEIRTGNYLAPYEAEAILAESMEELNRQYLLHPLVDILVARNLAERYMIYTNLAASLLLHGELYSSNIEHFISLMKERDELTGARIEAALSSRTTLDLYIDLRQRFKDELMAWDRHIIETTQFDEIKTFAQEDLELLEEDKQKLQRLYSGEQIRTAYSQWPEFAVDLNTLGDGAILADA